MQDLASETDRLIDKLSNPEPRPGSTEARVVAYLSRIAAEAHAASDPRRISPAVADLRHFWTNAVPWCSDLSRDLEKLLIMHAELVEAAGGD